MNINGLAMGHHPVGSGDKMSAISDIFSMAISNWFKFDSYTTLAINRLVAVLLTGEELEYMKTLLASLFEYRILIGFIAAVYFGYVNREKFLWIFQRKKQPPKSLPTDVLLSVDLRDTLAIQRFLRYMQESSQFFKQYNVQNLTEDQYTNVKTGELYPEFETAIEFDDTRFGAKGYISFSSHDVSIAEPKKEKDSGPGHSINKKQIALKITLRNSSIQEYLTKVQDYVIETESSSRQHHSIYSNGNNNEYTYISKLRPREEREQMHIRTFFSPHLARLWRDLELVHHRPEEIRKLGQTPSVQLILYGPPGTGKSSFAERIARALGRHIMTVDLRADLQIDVMKQVMYYPKLRNAQANIKDIVIILDEFDSFVEKMVEDAQRERESKKEDKGRSGNSQRLVLRDLLGLLQGPIQADGRIIIATTNRIRYIREKCPELLREGRLTPVLFDNLDWKTLQDLTRFYFDRDLDIEPIPRLPVPTSAVIQKAVSCKCNTTFEEFRDYIESLRNEPDKFPLDLIDPPSSPVQKEMSGGSDSSFTAI